ncbi:ferredoxin [archaeon]|jgi:ferredoxin|nr:ferredoxin [archaeon]
MAKYKIIHDREGCIGCGACASLDPNNWEMSSEDGKANLLENTENEKELEENFDQSKEVAESCPVNVIHIEKDNEKII